MATLEDFKQLCVSADKLSDSDLAAVEELFIKRFGDIKHDRRRRTDMVYRAVTKDPPIFHEHRSKDVGYLIRDMGAENVIMYIEQIGEYFQFTDCNKYMNFVNLARRKSFVDPDLVDFIKYQIITEDSPHKFTLMYREDCDRETLNKVEQAIRDKFGVKSKSSYNELWRAQQTVAELPVKNFDESTAKFDELRNHMRGSDLARTICQPKVERDELTLRGYIMPRITHVDDLLNIQEVINDLVSCNPGSTINVTINATNAFIGGGNIVNNNIRNGEREQKTALSRAWIKANLPADREHSADYRKRYEAACMTHGIEQESIQLMSKYVKTFGYKIKHNNSRNYWVKIQ